jgi:hypothetical protein
MRQDKYGNGVYLILALAIRYIDRDYALRDIMLLSKEAKQRLSKQIYK